MARNYRIGQSIFTRHAFEVIERTVDATYERLKSGTQYKRTFMRPIDKLEDNPKERYRPDYFKHLYLKKHHLFESHLDRCGRLR